MKSVIAKLDAVHDELLVTIGRLDDQAFSRRPSENEWSVAEIVHHLCLVEERILQGLAGALGKPPRKINPLRRLFPLWLIQYRGLRISAPKYVQPLNPPPREISIANFNRARQELRSIALAAGWERLRNMSGKHPVLGVFDGVMFVRFAGLHELRHLKQIRGIIKRLEPN